MVDCAKLPRMEATNAYVRKDGKVKIVPMVKPDEHDFNLFRIFLFPVFTEPSNIQ